mgnify:CR=1 FL=1
MKGEVIFKDVHHFPDITVLVPQQKSGKSLVVRNLMDDIPKDTEDPREGLKELIHVIANIVVFEGDNPEPETEFDPPIEFRVSYKDEYVEIAGGQLYDLVLAYRARDKWVIISDPSYDYHIFPPSTARVAEVKIWSWIGDPVLAWGK